MKILFSFLLWAGLFAVSLKTNAATIDQREFFRVENWKSLSSDIVCHPREESLRIQWNGNVQKEGILRFTVSLQSENRKGKAILYLLDSRGKVTGPTAISTSATASDRMPSQPFLAPRPTGETRSSKDGPAPVTGYTPGARQSFSNMPQRSAAPSPLRR